LYSPNQLAIKAQCARHVDSLPMRQWLYGPGS
jgi:hypothetical protein